MRISLRFLLFLVPVIAVAIFGSLKVMDKLESQWLRNDLARRSKLIADSTHDYLVDNLNLKRINSVTKLLNRISKDERLVGALLCAPDGGLMAKSDAIPSGIGCDQAWKKARDDSSNLIQAQGITLHEAVYPVSDEDKLLGYLIVLHDTSYMAARHETTSRYIVILLSALSILFFAITLIVYRWSMSTSVGKLQSVFRALLTGEKLSLAHTVGRSELSPLVGDLSKVVRELRHAKELAKDVESGLLWTPSRLRSEVKKYFGDSQICVIANREPYVHNRKGENVELLLPASGLVTAVEPIVRACSGLWIAHGSGTADKETADQNGKLLVPPENPEYVLKRVWLTKEEEEGYYYGFSNEGLWPLCHIAHTRPNFDGDDWKHYMEVNKRFADAFAQENQGANPIVLIQDYHFALLPKMIRERRKDAVLSLFWHIPWPNPEAFGICPWKKELLEGMVAADVIGFHTQFHCNNFLDTVDRFMEARVDREQFSINVQGHVCFVKPFSISVEWPSRHAIPVERFQDERSKLLSELNLPSGIMMGIGVDRVDYTKGIIERMRSVGRLLEKHPDLIGKFTFIQIGAPSRTHIKRYQDLNSEVQEVADEVNWHFKSANVPPIILKLSHHNSPELYRYYRAADVCFVSSLHDGMNLVAKEYISARADNGGALVLSTFTGASRELGDALLVNPYDIDECSDALHRALTMSRDEKLARMKKMRSIVAEKNVYAWGGAMLGEVHRIAQLRQASLVGPEPSLRKLS